MRRVFLLVISLSLGACSTTPSSWSTLGTTQRAVDQVLATGKSLLGKRPQATVAVQGRSFVLDCVGTVSAAYWGAGIDLRRDFSRYSGDGVNRLYESLKSWGALHWQATPSPGDLIFWDRTWDVGDDPNFASGHTHVGLVLQVDGNGTVHYLHESESRGVVVAYLNLYNPKTGIDSSGKVLNSPMYSGSGYDRDDNPPRWLSGDLWSAFGDGRTVLRTAMPQ